MPESPRWLFIHGREEEAEQIVGEIEEEVREETGEELPEADETLTVHQRERIPFREIARTAFSKYPRRTVLGLSLFVGQAFLYNAVTFDLGTLLGEFFNVGSGTSPSTSPSSRSPTSSARCCSGGSSTRSGASR